MYSFDEESREWLKRETLELFDTHGTEHLRAFATHIKEGYGPDLGIDNAAFTLVGVARGAQRRVHVRNSGGVLGVPEEKVPGLQATCRLSELGSERFPCSKYCTWMTDMRYPSTLAILCSFPLLLRSYIPQQLTDASVRCGHRS